MPIDHEPIGARWPLRIPSPVVVTCLLLAVGGCGRGEQPDAYGNFETTEVVVAAKSSGQLVRFDPKEGALLAAGAVVGQIDTATLAFQRQELASQREAATSRGTEVRAQAAVLAEQLRTAQKEYARTRRLFDDQAATRQQLDQAEGQVRVLLRQIEAVRAQGGTAGREVGSAAARVSQVEERIRDTRVVNPSAGTVLTTYAEAGEVVQAGQPLYKVGELGDMVLRAYVSGAQLPGVKIGQTARVTVDAAGGGRRTVSGRVTWIASEAEFTPTPVQTRDERADLVYAVEIHVPNPDGAIKIGMPGEVDFPGIDSRSGKPAERTALRAVTEPGR
ncbi:MAG: putative transport system, lipoprotein [Gemmatimonadetes bacterium]|nr:putative transport system, lipoprotein [Gemmatimonadota bacterium]